MELLGIKYAGLGHKLVIWDIYAHVCTEERLPGYFNSWIIMN